MSQGLNVLQNSADPDAPDSGYRSLYPKSDGWYEIDSAGLVFKLTNAVTGSGVVATNGFTLTLPATGTAALLEAANVYTTFQTMPGLDVNSGIGFATGQVRVGSAVWVTADGALSGYMAGVLGDVLLYRGGASLWQTPDSLTVDGALSAGLLSGVARSIDFYGGAAATRFQPSFTSAYTISGMTELGNIILRETSGVSVATIDWYADGNGAGRDSQMWLTVRDNGTQRYLIINGATNTLDWAGGINVGTASGATAGMIITSGDVRFQNGLEAGLSGSNAYIQGYNRTTPGFRGIEVWTNASLTALFDTSRNTTLYGVLNVGGNSAAAASILLTSGTALTYSNTINFRHNGSDKWIIGTNVYTGDSTATFQIGTGANMAVKIIGSTLGFHTYGGLNVGLASGAAVGAINMTQISTPGNPGSNHGALFIQNNGLGKSQLCIRFDTGAAIVLATQA